MARIPINTSTPNSGLGATLRQAITDLNTMMTELYTTVVFQEAGKALSSNDFTGPLQTKLNEIAAGAEVNVQADLLQADSTADSFIENKDALLPASPLSVMSGLAEGALLTINTNTAKFNRAAGVTYIVDGHSDVDNPTVTRVEFQELLAITTPFLATNKETHVAVDVNGFNYLTAVPLTATERRNYARLGVLIHNDNNTITRIDPNPTVNIEAGGQIQDILEAFGFRSLSGNRILPVGTNKKIKKELGRAFRSGANFKNLTTQPHSFILDEQNPITFNYITQTGAELATTTDIDPSIIDINGTFTAMPSTATFASIQRVYIFQNGTVKIQPGQRSFVDLPTAINLINSGDFINDFDIENNALYLGAIAVTRNNTNLSNTAEAIFVPSAGTSVNGSVSAPPLAYTSENVANKQNSLVVDGTGAKYPTIDAIIASVVTLFGNQSIFGIKSFLNRMLVGTSTDNGADALQVNGTASFTNDVKVSGINFGRGSGSISSNSAAGVDSLSNNTTGFNNSAFGENTLKSNVSASNITAIGRGVLALSTGGSNTSVGSQSSAKITVGSNNTVIGKDALANSTTASNNFAGGLSSMLNNVAGSENVSVGFFSMLNTNANSNTAVGSYAILGNTNGINNASFAHSSGRFIADKTTLATVINNSVFVGYRSSPLASNQTNQVVVGYDAIGLGSNTSVLGNSSTVFSRVFGRNLIGTSVDNGNDALQVNGTAQITGETKILDLAGSGNRNVSAAASGILVINTVYSVFADNAAAIAGGLQIGEFYRTSTGALFVRF